MNYFFIISVSVATVASLVSFAMKTVYAETVVNNFSVESHSGGNTAQNGETVTGTTKSSVDIQTTIDGEVVEDIHETSSKGSIYVEHTVVTRDSKTITTTNTNTENTKPKSIPIVPEREEPYVAPTVAKQAEPIDIKPQSSNHLDDTVSTNTLLATIISKPKVADTSSIAMSEELAEHPSLFARFFSAVSKTLAYVLSTIFS